MVKVDLLNKDQVSQLIFEIEASTIQQRTMDEFRGAELYQGKIRDHVVEDIKCKRPHTWPYYTYSTINILKKVVDKIAKAYVEPPARQIVGNDNNPIVKDNEAYAKIIENGNFNWSLQNLDTIFNTHRHALLWVQNSPADPLYYTLKPLPPYVFYVVIDNYSNQLIAVILSYPDVGTTNNYTSDIYSDGINQAIAESKRDSGAQTRTYAMWTATQHVNILTSKVQNPTTKEIVTQITYIKDPANPEMKNLLGVLPFVWLTKEYSSPERPEINPMFQQCIDINSMNSELLTGARISAVGVLKIKFPNGSDFKDFAIGHNIALKLPQSTEEGFPETDAEYISPNPNLSGIKEVFNEYTEAVISDQGINNFSLTGQKDKFTSGFDRALAMADVTEIRNENKNIYKSVEESIFEIVKAYDAVNGTKLFSIGTSINVHFPDPAVISSDKEKLEIIKMKDELGLIEEHEKIMMDSGLSEEDAKAKLERIKENKKKNVDMFMGKLQENSQYEGEDETQDDVKDADIDS